MDIMLLAAVSILLTLISVIIFTFAFWLWMLVDCLRMKNFKDKLVWIIVLIFLNLIGALLYFFIVKNEQQIKKRR